MNIDISLPTSWQQLTDSQLKTVFTLLSSDFSAEQIMTLCLLKWNRIKVIAQTDKHGEYWAKYKGQLLKVTSRQIASALYPLEFIKQLPSIPVRYSKLKKKKPIPADFQGVPFETYIVACNIFQGYLHTENLELLKQLVQIMYDSDKIKPTRDECIMAFYWMASLKNNMAARFHHFYQPIGEVQEENMLGGASLHKKLMEQVNAMIRALTEGDVTKEPFVMKMDTIRALTELDAKAEEAEKLKKMYKT